MENKYVVTWTTFDGEECCRYFTKFDDANKFAKELSRNDNVNHCVYIYVSKIVVSY